MPLSSDLRNGLDSQPAAQLLNSIGPNTLRDCTNTPWYVVLTRQFTAALILILLVAAAISFAVGNVTDAFTILVIVLFNGLLGFIPEQRAEKAIEELQRSDVQTLLVSGSVDCSNPSAVCHR